MPQSTIFQLFRDASSSVEPVLSKNLCALLKDTMHKMSLSLEPATPRSQDKHSTTEPLRSLFTCTATSIKKVNAILYFILELLF